MDTLPCQVKTNLGVEKKKQPWCGCFSPKADPPS